MPPTRIVCVDLDSTLCDTRQRHHLAPEDKLNGDWSAFSMACGEDAPVEGVVRLLQMLSAHYPIFFWSGRSHEAMSLTSKWIQDHVGIEYESIRLHRPGDPHDNAVYKVGLATMLREEGYEIVLAIEDWPAVAAALELIGIPTVLVNPNYDDSVMATFAQAYAAERPSESGPLAGLVGDGDRSWGDNFT